MRKYIFTLECCKTNVIKYVGHSVNPIRKYYYYCYHKKTGVVGEWVKKERPRLKVVCAVNSRKRLYAKLKEMRLKHKENLIEDVRRDKTIMMRFLVTVDDFKSIMSESKRLGFKHVSEYLRSKVF